MVSVKIFLFGAPRIEQNGEILSIDRQKAVAILTYLLVDPVVHQRDTLATFLWPTLDQSRARAGLRRVLSTLNKVLGSSCFLTTRETVGINSDCTQWVDICEFQQQIAAWRACCNQEDNLCPACVKRLATATALYQNDLLKGFTLRDAPAFDDWLYFEREELHRTQTTALEQLVKHYTDHRAWEAAIEQANRWQALDPINERAHRWLMDLYAHTDRYALAHRQYERCEQLLRQELDVPPAAATVALLHAIKTQHHSVNSLQMEPIANKTLVETYGKLLEKREAPVPSSALFVARERELAHLHQTLASVERSAGQLLFVIGGPGRGKTMLVQEFARQALARDETLLVVTGICNAHAGIGDPFLPFRMVIRQLICDGMEKGEDTPFAQLQMHRCSVTLPMVLPLLVEMAPDLIENFVSGKMLLKQAAAFGTPEQEWMQKLKQRTECAIDLRLEQRQIFSQYTALLKAIAHQHPLLIILEDLHWADASSTSLLFHLSREITNTRIYLLGTYRPNELLNNNDTVHPFAEITHELQRRHGNIWLDLAATSEQEGRHFVEAYLTREPYQFSVAFQQALYAHTLGHPLFTVELLRTMQERGDLVRSEDGRWIERECIDWQTLPVKVEGVIAQRLSRLDEELRRSLTIASVEGELFTAEVVALVQGCDERQLVQRLSQEVDKQQRLITAVSVERVGKRRLSRFRFRHHLFQYYLYHQLTESERSYLHEDVGTWLETLYGHQQDQIVAQLAHHFQLAQLPSKSITYLLQAGRQANRLAAHKEAITHLSQGLTQLVGLTDTQERLQAELELQLAIGPAYRVVKGYNAQEFKQTYDRAYSLCRQLGQTPHMFPILWGICSYYMTSMDLQKAHALAEQCLALAQQQQDPHQLLAAHRIYATIVSFLGNSELGRDHLEAGVAIYQAEGYQTDVQFYGMDNGLICLCYLTWTVWMLGYPDQARRYARKTLQQLSQVSHPFSQRFAQALVCHLWISLNEWNTALSQTQALVALAVECGAIVWASYGKILQGAALTGIGQASQGIVLIEQGMKELQQQGLELSRRYFLARLAIAYGQTGATAHAIDLVNEALASISGSTDCYYEAELHRQQGILLLQFLQYEEQETPSAALVEQAEASFDKAIEVARRQGNKSFELRAAINLARLWQQQGKRLAAKEALAEIFGWFTEGFDTVDLQEARQLLAELA